MNECYFKKQDIPQTRDCIKYADNVCTGRECLPLKYNGINQIFYPIGYSDMLGKCYHSTENNTIHQPTVDKLVRELEE